jgi:5-methylcytosine-specific restriction protein A
MQGHLSVLGELKPKTNLRIMDLVKAAGIDVSDWANFKGGKMRAASNPKYCYEWAFAHETCQTIALTLWHGSMREQDGNVSIDLNFRKSVRKYADAGKGTWKARAEKVDSAIQQASKKQLPIRVIVVDGIRRPADDFNASSRVKHRWLDPMPWVVASYDWKSGDCTLTRGIPPGRFVDQFLIENSNKPEVERREISGTAYVRNAALRAHALNRANGRCEYCAERGFARADGTVFLETHHIIPLEEDGPDTEENIAAVCPNHHREAHHGVLATQIRQTLLKKRRATGVK